jgi:hypothetical protein
MSDVKVLKLFNGIEVIGEFKNNDDGTVTAVRPLMVQVQHMPQPSGPPKIGASLFPYAVLSDDEEFELPKDLVATGVFYNPSEQLKEKYRRFFSDIIIPEKSLLTETK